MNKNLSEKIFFMLFFLPFALIAKLLTGQNDRLVEIGIYQFLVYLVLRYLTGRVTLVKETQKLYLKLTQNPRGNKIYPSFNVIMEKYSINNINFIFHAEI